MASLVTRAKNRLNWMYLGIADNLPGAVKDMSWKLRWRMRHDRNPMFVVIQDKYTVKEYAAQRGVRSAEQYYVTEDPETIPFDKLPDSYFIKANHGCKWNIYCKNGEFYYYSDGEDLIGRKNFSKHKITREQVIEYCKVWLKTVYSHSEWAYTKIVPKIMVEEVLEQYGGGELIDYRCFTFRGVVKAVYVDSATYSVNHQKIFVDANWKEFPLKNLKEDAPHTLPPMPENYKKIVSAAENLAKDFDFVRVDLYDTTRGVTLGEMSLYHNGGTTLQPTPDRDFNKWLGDQWVLPGE
ncbi:MAG: ATP-grasp fold amidoligase family protein [Anaerolineales bacterium]